MDERRGVLEAFRELQKELEGVLRGEVGAEQEAFRAVFRLNIQIGKLGRKSPRSKELMQLQLAVNAITVALKRRDGEALRYSAGLAKKLVTGQASE